MSNILDRFFAAMATAEGAADMIAEDATIIGVREHSYDALPIYGTYKGPDGFATFVATLRKAFDTQLFQVDQTMVAGNRGFATGRFIHRMRATGLLFHSHWALYAEFEGEQLSLYRFFEDTAALEESHAVTTTCTEDVA